jgi:DNA polymerase-4/DNA polymerase V
MIQNWPNAVAHVDADYFYANCELARNPQLRGKPVMVFGRLDTCILAKTPEAKKMGITTAIPSWEAKKLCPNGIYIKGDFRYYTLISRQLMQILKEWSPEVEVYSVDEAFMDMNGLRGMYRKSYPQLGDMIRQQVQTNLGITVSVGISVNKTLAKMACEINKPNATTVVNGKQIKEFLSQIPVREVPGIGFSREALLKKYRVETCQQLAELPESFVHRLFGKMGILLWRELRGELSFPITPYPPPPKTIGRTSSFDTPVNDVRKVEGLAFFHLERALQSLHRNQLLAGEISLYLRDKPFRNYCFPYRFATPTMDFFKLAEHLGKLIREIPAGQLWRSAGVMLDRLSPAENLQFDLFEGADRALKSEKVMHAKAKLNERYGQHAVRSGSTLFMNENCSKKERMGMPLL